MSQPKSNEDLKNETNAKIYEYLDNYRDREVTEILLHGLFKIVEQALAQKDKEVAEAVKFLHGDLKEGGMYDGKVSAEFQAGWKDALQWLTTFINPGMTVAKDLTVQKDAEVAEAVSKWVTHNAKTIYHNNGHREYVDVRDLLDFLSTPKE